VYEYEFVLYMFFTLKFRLNDNGLIEWRDRKPGREGPKEANELFFCVGYHKSVNQTKNGKLLAKPLGVLIIQFRFLNSFV